MKTAERLVNLDSLDAQAQAEDLAIAKNQIWEGEGFTKYTFDDNSVLIQSGPAQYGLDADSRESIETYRLWLGRGAEIEAAEIDRLLEALDE